MNDFIKSIFPIIGTALGGPAGTMLGGVAASFVAEKLGLADSTVEAVKEVLNSGRMTPEQIAALKLAEMEMKKWADTHKIDVMKVETADRADARKMQVASNSRMPAILTIMVTIGFFSVLGILLWKPELKANEVVLIMVGQLSAVWGACTAFYVSTTFSSGQKNQLLANSTQAK